MNYLKSLLELIIQKYYITDGEHVDLSLNEIADAWQRNPFSNKSFNPATISTKELLTAKIPHVEEAFLCDIWAYIKEFEKEEFISSMTSSTILYQLNNPEDKIRIKIIGDIESYYQRIEKTGNIKYRFPHAIPAGTQWENIHVVFQDEETVAIKIGKNRHTANYREMGFIGKGKKESILWEFLKTLAFKNKEITIKDSDSKLTYKKQKELLSKKLKAYFGIEYDPFYPYEPCLPYKHQKSYKIKLGLLMTNELYKKMGDRDPTTQNPKRQEIEKDDDIFYKEQIGEA